MVVVAKLWQFGRKFDCFNQNWLLPASASFTVSLQEWQNEKSLEVSEDCLCLCVKMGNGRWQKLADEFVWRCVTSNYGRSERDRLDDRRL